ncbi:MAG: hypothetical protein KBB78_02670 [Candidatus Pacebacteria bacterium]|nr:hypothetical protein [Candidatus Paceibacterota bacterium]
MRALKISLIASMFALSLGAPAFAEEQHNSPPPPPPSCGGNACVTQWTVGGTALFGGAGASMFEGAEGFNLIEKSGSGGVDITVNADGGLCGVDCSDGGFTFEGFSRETVSVSTGAFGEVSGTSVTAQNMGQAIGAVNFSLSKNFSAPAPSGN